MAETREEPPICATCALFDYPGRVPFIYERQLSPHSVGQTRTFELRVGVKDCPDCGGTGKQKERDDGALPR